MTARFLIAPRETSEHFYILASSNVHPAAAAAAAVGCSTSRRGGGNQPEPLLWPVPAEGIQQFTAVLVSDRAAAQPVKPRSYMHHHIKRQ